MFLFPWLYRGQPISDFEKIDIFGVTLYFQPLQKGPLEGQKAKIGDLDHCMKAEKIPKSVKKSNFSNLKE